METNENSDRMVENLWGTTKEVLHGKFIAIGAYVKTQGRCQIQELNTHFQKLEKQQQQNDPSKKKNRTNHQSKGGNKPNRN